MTTHETYYAAIGSDDRVIYGIGTTEAEALADAINGAGYTNQESYDADGGSPFEVLPMTPLYYAHVRAHGFHGGSASWAYDSRGRVDFYRDEED